MVTLYFCCVRQGVTTSNSHEVGKNSRPYLGLPLDALKARKRGFVALLPLLLGPVLSVTVVAPDAIAAALGVDRRAALGVIRDGAWRRLRLVIRAVPPTRLSLDSRTGQVCVQRVVSPLGGMVIPAARRGGGGGLYGAGTSRRLCERRSIGAPYGHGIVPDRLGGLAAESVRVGVVH